MVYTGVVKMRVKVKVKTDLKNFEVAKAAIVKETATRIQDIGDSLAMTASGAAPHDQGILEKSYKVKNTPTSTTVSFSAKHNGFDYTIKMHDGIYNLGPGSLAKSGGVGMSGKTYRVGPKFLTRPLEGEKDTYTKYIGDALATILRSF
mgnify:CR=1 FL=1